VISDEMFWINLTDGSEVRRRNKDGGKRASVTVAGKCDWGVCPRVGAGSNGVGV